MKKFFIAALLVAAIGGSAFATDANRITVKVKNSFETLFAGAENVSWTLKDAYTKADFTLADEKVEAFFAADGDLIAISRKVDLKTLPLGAIQKIKKQYGSYTVTEAIEFTQDNDKSYYVSLQDGAKKQILQVSLYGDVSVYTGAKK